MRRSLALFLQHHHHVIAYHSFIHLCITHSPFTIYLFINYSTYDINPTINPFIHQICQVSSPSIHPFIFPLISVSFVMSIDAFIPLYIKCPYYNRHSPIHPYINLSINDQLLLSHLYSPVHPLIHYSASQSIRPSILLICLHPSIL